MWRFNTGNSVQFQLSRCGIAFGLIVFGFLILLSSCNLIIRKCYGIKNNKGTIKYSTITKFSKKLKIDTFYTVNNNYLNLHYSTKNYNNYFFQPLQVKFYSTINDSLTGMIVNCQVGGFPNLKWKRSGCFDSFSTTTKLDTFPLLKNELIYFSNNLSQEFPKISKSSKYTILVYYSVIMNRQTKRLIKLVRKSFKTTETKIIYINSDLFLSKIIYN